MSGTATAERAVSGAALLRQGGVPGAVAGVAGGLVFGLAMTQLGMLATVASLVRSDSPVVGFGVHLAIAAAIGGAFGMLVLRQTSRAGEILYWGLAYGVCWWFLGALTLLPLLLGEPVGWDLASARAALPSLVGHLAYGGTVALGVVALRGDGPVDRDALGWGVLLRGGVAGVAAAAVVSAVGGGWRPLAVMTSGGGWAAAGLLVLGVLVGVGYPLVFTARPEGSGPALVRGASYGFLWWLVTGLTVPPLLDGRGLDWSPAAARVASADLPGYLLVGAATALFFSWLTAAVRALFVDDVRRLRDEGVGARSLRAVGWGALSGLVGGLVFTVVMAEVGALPAVSRLVGADSSVAGLLVHLVIAQLIGVSFALLFSRRSFSLASALGWGVCYGFFWWVLGALTLFPVLLGGRPVWGADELAAAFPSLVGHLAYGAAVGLVYYRLELRASPWWLPRGQAEAERLAAQREQLLGSAPALWALTVLIALTIPLLVGG